MTPTRKFYLYLSILAVVLLCALRGIQIYQTVAVPTSTATTAPKPIPQKMTYTISLTREVTVPEKK
jgi:hypothetical protein